MSAVAGAGRGEFWSGVGHGGVDGAVVAHCAIGDVHGDRDALRDCLRAAAARDDAATWIAEPRTLLVSCAIFSDRGEDDWGCVTLLRQDEARATEGDVALLLGNHEMWNLDGDLSMASPASVKAVEDDFGVSRNVPSGRPGRGVFRGALRRDAAPTRRGRHSCTLRCRCARPVPFRQSTACCERGSATRVLTPTAIEDDIPSLCSLARPSTPS